MTKDDIILAEAITKDPINYQEGDHTPYYWCDYCSAELHGYGANISDFTHDPDCPVLVAQKALAEAEVEPPPVIVEGGDAAKQAADDLFWINFHKKQQSEKEESQ